MAVVYLTKHNHHSPFIIHISSSQSILFFLSFFLSFFTYLYVSTVLVVVAEEVRS